MFKKCEETRLLAWSGCTEKWILCSVGPLSASRELRELESRMTASWLLAGTVAHLERAVAFASNG